MGQATPDPSTGYPREIPTLVPYRCTGGAPYGAHMASFEVTLRDRTVEVVAGADAYQQEGPMTTFFHLGDGREVVDCWSQRVASVRTADVLLIRRADEASAALRAVG